MFPYSNYVPPKPVSSFEGIDRELLDNYSYDFKLRHDRPQDCDDCAEIVQHKPFLTLRIENNKFILRVEDANYVKNLMDQRNDGFAVEIVRFDDYMCGNPAYFTKPSRRNNQLKLNGEIIQPLKKKDLEKGFKKRSKRKEVKFLSYVFKSDSLKFFKRFGRYKMDRYNFEYFEISLGRVPRDIGGYWAHNLIYIQDNQICHVDYFTSYCGEIIDDYQPAQFLPASAEGNCQFSPEEKLVHFSIPFEQGKSDFTKEDIEPFIESISNLSYELDSVRIKAYSSIEGDSLMNAELQMLRAKNIADVLKENQEQNVPLTLSTATDWEGFYQAISRDAKWRHLRSRSKAEILQELNKVGLDKVEYLLKKERRGEIDLFCTIPVEDQNLEYFMSKELRKMELAADKGFSQDELGAFNTLYECIHNKVVEGIVSPEFLAKVKMPENYIDHHLLAQNFILYGYEFSEAFATNEEWQSNHRDNEKYIDLNCSDRSHLTPQFHYILIRNSVNDYRESGSGDIDQLQQMINRLDKMQAFYFEDSLAQLNIDRLNFNINVLMLNTVFSQDPTKYSEDAIKSIAQLHEFYQKYELMNGNRSVELGKTAVQFGQINNAYGLMDPYVKEDSVLAYLLPLGYQHISSEGSLVWYEQLMEMSEQMESTIWCNVFFEKCTIPFQAFDYAPLRDVFCEKCMEKSDFLQRLVGTENTEENE